MILPPRHLNVARWLEELAHAQPTTLAVVCPAGRDRAGRTAYSVLNYEELNQECDRLAHGLSKLGIGRGVRTVLMVTPSVEFFTLTFALFKLGAVLVVVDPGMGIKNLGRCLDQAEPEAFIGITKAHVARCLLGWARRHLRLCITVGRKLGWSGLTYATLRAAGQTDPWPAVEVAADDLAAILFTSGSTGPPKGAEYTHGIFATQVETIRTLYDLRPGEIDLCTFPLFALFAPALGWTAVVPDMDASRPGRVHPPNIISAIQTFGVTTMFGSPALLERVGAYGVAHGMRLPSLRRVISAGAPVRAEVLETFARLPPEATPIHTPYGATEALPVATIASKEVLEETRQATAAGAGVCVGQPAANLTVRIISVSDEPIPTWSDELALPAGVIGEIAVRGPQVTQRYFRQEEGTRLAKIADPDGGPVWHRMGDLGYLDDRGRLWYCGRKAHRVETAAGTLYTECCEAIFNRHPHVRRTALVGVGSRPEQRPVLCVELKPEARPVDRAALRAELAALAQEQEMTRAIDRFLFHPEFPVDVRHNAKIFREQLAAWAAKELR